jgi:hypothetical protein
MENVIIQVVLMKIDKKKYRCRAFISPPPWYLCFVVVVGLVCLNELESHAGGNICYQ